MVDRVIVSGGGPVGLFTALTLARARIPVVVLEALPAIPASPRALGYQWPSAKLFAQAGILDDALAVGIIKRENQFRRPATGAIDTMSMSVLDTADESPYDLHVGQHVLADIILRNLLTTTDNAEVRWNTRVTGMSQDDDEVRVAVEAPDGPDVIRGSWLVGADGAHSRVREAAGLSFDGVTWPRRFVATNVHYDFEAHGYARATFLRDPVNWAIVIKINDKGLWRVAYGEDPDLTEDQVRSRVAEHYRVLLPGDEPYELELVNSYRTHERCSERFRVGRVLLAGDAAHICNPCGALGLMSGLFDAAALGNCLARVIHGVAPDILLDRYAEERRRIFLDVAAPRATENRRVLTESDPERMRQDDEELRHVCGNADILRHAVSFPAQIVGELALPAS